MARQTAMGPITEIPVGSLTPFPINPFGLYTGQRLSDLVESIEANGVLVPIIVHTLGADTFEILSGHNRVEAAELRVLELQRQWRRSCVIMLVCRSLYWGDLLWMSLSS